MFYPLLQRRLQKRVKRIKRTKRLWNTHKKLTFWHRAKN